MRFTTRNAYYLRISAQTVLPLYLYLDEQHVEWMSEHVLQHVLSDLRPLISTKLMIEADAHLGLGGSSNAKKGTLDVHRGDTYQFGYFLRNIESHAIMIKSRHFVAAPPKPMHAPPATVVNSTEKLSRGKRTRMKKEEDLTQPLKKTSEKRKGKRKPVELYESDEVIELSDSEDDDGIDLPTIQPPRRSSRKKRFIAGGYSEEKEEIQTEEPINVDTSSIQSKIQHEPVPTELTVLEETGLVVMGDEDTKDTPVALVVKAEEEESRLPSQAPVDDIVMVDDNSASAMDTLLVDDEDDKKPKPIMKLGYQGFSIHGRCLCVIVEPYSSIQQQRQMSLAPIGIIAPQNRAPNMTPLDFVPSGRSEQRGKTPLFLPDDDEVEPNIALNVQEDDRGMFAFSQILRSYGDYGAGAVEDDDEIEGAVFMGDADEAREF